MTWIGKPVPKKHFAEAMPRPLQIGAYCLSNDENTWRVEAIENADAGLHPAKVVSYCSMDCEIGSLALPASRAAALSRWQEFAIHLPRYAARRNQVTPGHNEVSRLSPALRHRLMLEEEVVDLALADDAFPVVEKFVQEVVWRTYWKGWLEMRPQVWTDYRRQLQRLRADAPKAVLRRAAEVAGGSSGVRVMDRFARELIETGYLHNHARMWWAGFWVHVERLPWQLGADFFFRHLLDADPASNTLGWRWVAGLQTRGKCYLPRRSNLERCCDPGWMRDTAGLEQLEDRRVEAVEVDDPVDLTPIALPDLPRRLTDGSERIGIWIHHDDALLEHGPLAELRPQSVAGFTSPSFYDHLGLSRSRQEHLRLVLEDATQRAGSHFKCPARTETASTTAEGLLRWARSEELQTVAAFAPFVGPVGDALPGIRRCLEEAGITLQLVRRSWDAQLFPYAYAGYFPFWKKTSQWLRQRRS